MKACKDCGKPLNAGSTSNSGKVRCLICQTDRSLRRPVPRIKHKARPELVRERSTGVRGRVLRHVWLIDRETDAPAILAYVVAFDDGREKRVLKSEIVKVTE